MSEASRVLYVGWTGRGNLGDDAITAGGLARLREVLPTACIDLVTDGGEPSPPPADVRWLGPLIDALPGLALDDLGPIDDGLAAALRNTTPDVVICDYNMPAFSAREALAQVRDADLDVPVILVSGEVGE